MNTNDEYTKPNLQVKRQQKTDDSLLNNFVEPDSEVTKVSYKELMDNI